jgi:hypothetical protein
MNELKSVKICIPSKKGKVLAALHGGLLVCQKGQEESKDDQWLFVKVSEPPVTVYSNSEIENNSDGYNIVSANFQLAMYYNPSTGEQVSVVPYNELDINLTVWHVTENGEIYTYDRDGNRKYLWSLSGNVYVTPDEYLAETWKTVSMEGYDIPLSEKKETDGSPVFVILFILLLLLIFFAAKRWLL